MLQLKQKLHASTEIKFFTVNIMQVIRLQGYSMILSDVKKNKIFDSGTTAFIPQNAPY